MGHPVYIEISYEYWSVKILRVQKVMFQRSAGACTRIPCNWQGTFHPLSFFDQFEFLAKISKQYPPKHPLTPTPHLR